MMEWRDDGWYCTEPGCARGTVPFTSAKSAASHPWAAHGIRSSTAEAAARRSRRENARRSRSAAEKIAVAFLESLGYRVTKTVDCRAEKRERRARERRAVSTE